MEFACRGTGGDKCPVNLDAGANFPGRRLAGNSGDRNSNRWSLDSGSTSVHQHKSVESAVVLLLQVLLVLVLLVAVHTVFVSLALGSVCRLRCLDNFRICKVGSTRVLLVH
eukprot:848207-Rhodomonas_salina.2